MATAGEGVAEPCPGGVREVPLSRAGKAQGVRAVAQGLCSPKRVVGRVGDAGGVSDRFGRRWAAGVSPVSSVEHLSGFAPRAVAFLELR